MESPTANPSSVLLQQGVRPSYQRIRIYDYLQQDQGHADAETIYLALHDEIPTLSRTTVYNTLNLFLQKGLIRVVSIDGVEKRYDAMLTDHGHFKCESCEKIYNFPVEMERISPLGLDGFQVTEKNVYFHGLCPDCVQNHKEKG